MPLRRNREGARLWTVVESIRKGAERHNVISVRRMTSDSNCEGRVSGRQIHLQ